MNKLQYWIELKRVKLFYKNWYWIDAFKLKFIFTAKTNAVFINFISYRSIANETISVPNIKAFFSNSDI